MVKADLNTSQESSNLPPKHAPAVWTNITNNVLAGIRRNKQTTIAALTIALWRVLITDRCFWQRICICRICISDENSCDTRHTCCPV